MKIALICPSNMLYMPYVDNYEVILKANEINYTIVNWDRFSIEKESEFIYRDKKIGHQRNYFDYYKYYRFVLKILKNNRFDKVIVFGLQMAYFLNKYLIKNYKGNYIIDIRDYNKIIKIFNPAKIIKNSAVTVISSPGYKQWLPESKKYMVNHNIQLIDLNELHEPHIINKTSKINISFIGAIRDMKINIDLINSLANNDYIDLYYHGEGDINKKLLQHLLNNNINNVKFTGRYVREDEENLYMQSDFINILRYNDSINNYTALPNRLYKSAFYGKPVIAFEETYLANITKEHNLGLVLKSLENIKEDIESYLANFNIKEYDKGREAFIEKVIEENKCFKGTLESFFVEHI